ncbi:MAG: DNA repair ATPase [Pirellulaceae bacterium]|nr:DNA repair ATPase [Pirellulaceae bacterium]
MGNLILLRIKPFREQAYRYLVFNEKTSKAMRLDSLRDACILLPEDHGLIFSNGYYLQTGESKLFDTGLVDLVYERSMPAANGEDYLYVFYNRASGTYLLLTYNMIQQAVGTPTTCGGFSFFGDGKLLLVRSDDTAQKHHALQIWQTPFLKEGVTVPGLVQGNQDSFLFKVGNRDVVRAMAECNEIHNLLNKDDSYTNLYLDLVKRTTDTVDTYFWLGRSEAFDVATVLQEIRNIATSAIDEFERVTQARRETKQRFDSVNNRAKDVLRQSFQKMFQSIDDFVQQLSDLRTVRGEIIGLRDLKYIDLDQVQALEKQVQEETEACSKKSVEFLLQPQALVPYHQRVEKQLAGIETLTKVTEANALQGQIEQTSKDLEMLIEIISNLKIDDATQRTKIIDDISAIYSQLNQTRAKLRNATKQLLSVEGKAEFHSQLKLLGQSVVNYLEVCDTPQRCDDYLTKTMVQLEELEGRFAEFDEFVLQLTEKREEIYSAFDNKKLQLQEARSRRASALMSAAERILGGIRSRVSQMDKIESIHAYFAADLMVEKVRDIVRELESLQESVKVDDVQSRLKTIREDSVRQLKDRQELFIDGGKVIQFGKYKFMTNSQPLDLTTVTKDGQLYFHLSGTNYFRPVPASDLEFNTELTSQEVVSENRAVYRSEYLAKLLYDEIVSNRVEMQQWYALTEVEMLAKVQHFMAPRYQESYLKGVHDHDAVKILGAILDKHQSLGILRQPASVRNLATFFWLRQVWPNLDRAETLFQLQGIRAMRSLFPDSRPNESLLVRLTESMIQMAVECEGFDVQAARSAAEYLYECMTTGDRLPCSADARHLLDGFNEFLQKRRAMDGFHSAVKALKSSRPRLEMVQLWLTAFVDQPGVLEHLLVHLDSGADLIDAATKSLSEQLPVTALEPPVSGSLDADRSLEATNENSELDRFRLVQEAALIYLLGEQVGHAHACDPRVTINGLLGSHSRIDNTHYQFDFYDFLERLLKFQAKTVPRFVRYVEDKKNLLERKRKELKLYQFETRVLTSFVRNRLINEVYLPLIGANLAKQMGEVGENKRTDLMGLLLLISPPGYGKTTLMEYVANRLGITFVKINGPAIGHQVTSLDPQEAPNASARQEVERLNLALEMGDNVMIYVDDIQHCNPEFLQKFISLCDGQRKIEGVFEGETRTYDLRGRKVAVVMAGNPYTESGDKFKIPDMLANRADTYNLGDVIGDQAHAFELSYLENCLTSNSALAPLQAASQKDVHTIIEMATNAGQTNAALEGNFSSSQVTEMVKVMQKLLKVRDVLLKVNALYIYSAAQADAYRTEPSFKMQGSYRDMAKIAEKIVPIMNDQELQVLIDSHFQNQAQTLTTDAEANLLKFQEITGRLAGADKVRWEGIRDTYRRNQVLGAAATGDDQASQIIAQLALFSDGLGQIRSTLTQGMERWTEFASSPDRTVMQNLTIQQIGSAVQQLEKFNQSLNDIKQWLHENQKAASGSSLEDRPLKVHVSNRVPTAFMKVITGQFQVLQAWMGPLLAIADKIEGGRELKRAAKATEAHYRHMLEAKHEDAEPPTDTSAP